jgi:outer membrane protein OmpA-like peptidoglycan-associated protein
MRTFAPLLILLAPLLPARSACAQITVDLNALSALPSPTAHPRPTRTHPHYVLRPLHPLPLPPPLHPLPLPPELPPTTALNSPLPQGEVGASEGARRTPGEGPPAKPPSQTVAIAASPPPPAAIPSVPANAPPAPPPIATPPSTPAVSAHPVTASITFSPNQTTLPLSATHNLTALGKQAAASPTATINVLAYAPADAHDPSVARRLSLDRALAIRSVLIAAGVPSSRIYLRALGASAPAGAANEAQISILGANLPATAQAQAQGKPQ